MCGATDLRKQATSLALLVEQGLKRDVFAAELFVFSNARRDRIRISYRERNGLVILEGPPETAETAVTASVPAALLEAECSELRARIETREQRMRLLEEALRVVKAKHYGPSRERLSTAAGRVELFNEIEATFDITEAVGTEPELKATPMRWSGRVT